MLEQKMVCIKQKFDEVHITDIKKTVREQLDTIRAGIKPGDNIAVAAGSRGIADIAVIVRQVTDWVREKGAHPFIVPAMGSHGGATAEGQIRVLKDLGITEQSVHAPVRSSMEVVEIPSNSSYKLYMDRFAFQSDGVIIVNRIKMHTDFRGKTESGLLKMCVIGLGKHKQAAEMHKYGITGLRDMIPKAARDILKTGKILFGVGIVENAYDKAAVIKAVMPGEMEQEEIRLLDMSKKMMPSLPIKQADVLIIDQMGKDISGTGMDTNIIGRLRVIGEAEFTEPDIKRIIVSDLTEASHGNALGVGLADFITRKLFSKIDLRTTYENILTSTFLERGKIPIIAVNEREALEYAFKSCQITAPQKARIIRIKNTLELHRMYISNSVLELVSNDPQIEVCGDFVDIFNDSGELKKLF
jgi:hypothetical protein